MLKKGYFSAKNVAWRELPSGYTQVEYLESNGAQHINARFKPNQNTRIVIKAIFPIGSATKRLFGARANSLSDAFCFTASSGGYYLVEYGTQQVKFPTSINFSTTITIDYNKNVVTINGAHTVTCAAATFAAPCDLVLFGMNDNGIVTGYHAIILECQVYDYDTLIRDFVPCLNADSTAGLFDMVNSVFYGNDGTGAFAVGDEVYSGVAREPKKIYFSDKGVARKAKKAYFGDKNGLAQKWFPCDVRIGTLPVGSSVFMNVSGVRTEFIVVQQGKPSSTYDDSCNGTWLLMKDIYEKRVFDSNYDNDFPNTDIGLYLNSTFINKLDLNVKNAIKTVKIPLVDSWGTDMKGTVRVFLLSADEVYASYEEIYDDDDNLYQPATDYGSILNYFKGSGLYSKRIAYFNGTADSWWLRTYYRRYTWASADDVCFINNIGKNEYGYSRDPKRGVRPAFVLPSETLVDGDFNITV